MNKKVKRFAENPFRLFSVLGSKGLLNWMPDELYLKLQYRARVGRPLNLDAPKTFNEKLQWLKLHDRNPAYTVMVDKVAVRDYIAQTLGVEYLVPLLGVWDSPEEMDFDTLPEKFVLKCNHNSGLGMCICRDKSALDREAVKKGLAEGLAQDYYLTGREWPYRDVPRRILAEACLEDDASGGLRDYKLMCFNGEVKCTLVCTGRFSPEGMRMTFFDRDWNVLPVKRHCPSCPEGLEKPEGYERMVVLAQKLAADIPFVRVDFYQVGSKIYFGELTFFPGAGFEEFTPEEWDLTLGNWLRLPDGRE